MEGFFLPLFFLFLLHVSLIHAQGDICALTNCGEGTCVPNNSPLGFDCVCFPGWKKFQPGPFIFPTCLLPNCTVDLGCGNNAPPVPSPLLPPPFNLTNPCNLVWCGDGKCVANGTAHYCQCYEGSTNLFNLSNAACFKPCSLGPDCSGLVLTLPPPLPPPPPPYGFLPLPPMPPVLQSPSNGCKNISKNSGSYGGLNAILLYLIILALVL